MSSRRYATWRPHFFRESKTSGMIAAGNRVRCSHPLSASEETKVEETLGFSSAEQLLQSSGQVNTASSMRNLTSHSLPARLTSSNLSNNRLGFPRNYQSLEQFRRSRQQTSAVSILSVIGPSQKGLWVGRTTHRFLTAAPAPKTSRCPARHFSKVVSLSVTCQRRLPIAISSDYKHSKK